MDLRSGRPFWLVKNGLLETYPPLNRDLNCEVVIIGGGITGALVAYTLLQQGVDVVVLDKRDIGWGSTSASTAMLQYEIDTELHELITFIGKERAVRSYCLGVEAIAALEAIAATLPVDCGFRRAPSIYATRFQSHLKRLRAEYAARQAAGLAVQFVEQDALQAQFGITAKAAIVSSCGAQLDPYRFTYALINCVQQQGGRVFDRTTVTAIEHKHNRVIVQTDRDSLVQAQKVVFATGYETKQYLSQYVVNLNSSFALISEPLTDDLAPQDYLLWETARPYFYMRSTADKRLILGGADVPFSDPKRRDRLIEEKTKQLLTLYERFYPDQPQPEVAYAWAGVFGETEDGLAYIGETPEYPNAYFALGYGGNGITYSMIAARIITDMFLGKANADSALFRFGRS
ncbi:MAG: FAD-dependent oxidoreductase [Caldilineaceae bacterium]